MLSVEAASVSNGCAIRESSTGSLWGLRSSFRFSCMKAYFIGSGSPERITTAGVNIRPQPHLYHGSGPGNLLVRKSASANPAACPDRSQLGKNPNFQYYCFWTRTVVVFRAYGQRAQVLTPCC